MTPRFHPPPPQSRAIAKILATVPQAGLPEETRQLLEAYITVAYQRGYEHGKEKALRALVNRR